MTTSSFDDLSREDIEVRVLGPLRVRRADGTVVRPSEWPTTQTADLLRILALHVGEAVHVETLLEQLWPHADEPHGRASLRTAASRVRKVLRANCVERRLGGLALTGAWVDAHAFRGLAQQVRRGLTQGDCAGALLAARQADALYLGDLLPHHASGDWVEREREALASAHRTMMLEAAEAAAQLAWWRDATELAERALVLEPCSERAYRVLMRAQRGTGEAALALKTYDRCRHALTEHVGADPSPPTQRLHQELLDPAYPPVTEPPFRGRGDEQAWLREVAAAAAADGRRAVVLLEAPAGAGKTRLVQETLGPRTTGRVVCRPDGDHRAVLDGAEDARRAPVVLVDDVHHLTAEQVGDLLRVTLTPVATCLVLAGRTLPPGLAEVVQDALGVRPQQLRLPPLAREEVSELCAAVLAGAVSDALVDRVAAETDGNPVAVLRTVREWVDTGRVAATSAGLVVLDTAPDADSWSHRLLALAVDRLSATEMEVLQLTAAAGRAVTPELLLPLVGLDEPSLGAIADALDRLVDLSLVSHSPRGCAARDEVFADLLLSWLRPSARRELHRRIAERATIPVAERVAHWESAGEPGLARAAALEAARAAADAEPEQVFPALRRPSTDAPTVDADRGDAAGLLLGWSSAATATGRGPEASATRSAADGDLTDLHARLRSAIRAADAGGDTADRWSARVRMIREVSVPGRRLRAVRRWARQAWELSDDPVLRAEVLVHAWTPAAVLGDALRAERGLAQAAALLGDDRHGDVADRLAALRCLVAHDL
ncbi:hypothetical protein N866_04225, partial [Actinotalea ferrariae CF5-4]